jgi:hypothetical protein
MDVLGKGPVALLAKSSLRLDRAPLIPRFTFRNKF